MNKDEDKDRLLTELFDARVDAGNRSQPLPPVPTDNPEVAGLVDVADLLWEAAHGAPPLENDPVALLLGLVPDPDVALDPRALSRVRQNAKVDVSDLAGRLAQQGWDVSTRDAFRWEQAPSTLSPALIAAIAEELGAAPDAISVRGQAKARPSWLDAVTESSSFAALVARWTAFQGVPSQLAASALESRMLAAVHRGGRPDPEQLLRSLDAFVSALEQVEKK